MGRIYFNARRETHTVDGAYTVTAADSGKVFMLSSTAGACEITLPTTLEEGLYYKFIVEEDTPTGVITIAAGGTNKVDLVMKDIGGDASNSTAGTQVDNIVIAVATKQGDYIDMFTDGSTWYAECMSSTNNSITTS